MVNLTPEYLAAAFTGKIKPSETAVQFYNSLKVHFDGEYPGDLIDERRPSESLQIKEYRKKIYKPKTKGACSKIITSLQKIRKSPDYNVRYDDVNVPASIKEEERPKVYFEEVFPVHKSLTNWVFSVLLKEYLIDSNAVIMVIPTNIGAEDNVYLKPFPYVFNCNRVLDYFADSHAILLSDETVTYKHDGTDYTDGQVCYVVTAEYVQRWEQTSPKKAMQLKYDFKHGLGYMPAFKTKGNYACVENNRVIYQSKISPIVPSLDEAVREYSDLQAEVVQHIHSEKWIYATQTCNTCNGTGKLRQGDKIENCTNPKCSGGRVTNNPYETLVVTPPNNMEGNAPIPTPPAGYIQKQIEIVGIQDKRVKEHIYEALSAINMEFLAETPLNQSGTAKEVDKDELNNFVHSIAEDLINITDEIAITIMKYRYGAILKNDKDLIAVTPIFAVPERFDLLNTSHLLTEIKSAKDSGVNTYTLNELMIDYVNKKFNQDKEIARKLEAIIKLDPLSGYTQDDKLTMVQNDGVSDLDYVISCNIESFINQAIADNPIFLSLPEKEKKAKIKELAEAKTKEISTATSLLKEVDISQGGGAAV